MCVQQFQKIFDVHRYSSRVLTAPGTSKHDVESYLDPDVFAPDPAELYDSDDSSCGKHLYLLNDFRDIMNSSEDEPLSGLNLRLRPRRRTTSLQSKNSKKSDSRTAQDKPKRTRTPSRALPNKPDDLTNNADSFPVPQHLCPHCDRKFSSKQTVSKHARRIHLSDSKQDFFIACLFCNHTEAEANEIIRHMVDNHPNQYFACLDCQTRFSSTSELAEHKLNVCERQKPYRSKLRQKNSSKHTQKNLNIDERDDFQNDKEYIENRGFNGIVISCELKPSQIHDEADIEDNITTNLILPPSKSLANSTVIEKNAVIVLDDIQWNKRIPPNFSFHNTDADQILSRLGVVHRSPRTGETTRRDWFKTIDDSTQKFEKCFETSFYSKVASNVAENLAKCLDGSFNFNPDLENTIKTRRAKNSVAINTAEGFPILLAREQFSRNLFDSYMPRSIAPKHKWKWDSPESDKSVINADQVKRDSHTNNCIITLVSSLDIWTQLSMRKKFENKFNISHAVKKTEKQSIIDKELKEILESREIPTTSSTQIIQYSNSPPPVRDGLEFPSYLGLTPSAPSYDLQPAVLSGEWVRPRCYVCCACGAQTRDSRALSSHISIQHPNAQVQHYEIVGEPLLNADILKHLYVPPSQVFNRTRPLRGIRDCTKCQKSISLEDLHQHMLDCAGDTPAVRRKCRYRPFGVRRRRPRLPDNVMRRKIRKDLRNRHKQKNHLRSRQKIRSEVGDAETIRKMIADLPAKRHRVVVNPLNPTLRPRRKLDKQRSTLLIKHRSTDDSKSRKLRSVKDRNNSSNSVNIPPHKEEENKMIPNQDDEDNKPLKPTRRPNDGKNTRHSDSIKRKTVLNRAKRKIHMKNINIVKLPDLDTVDANSSSNSPDEEFQKINAPKKIDVNNSQYSSRQHSGRGNYNRSSSNRGRNHRGNNDRGNFDRGNTNRGSHDRGNNNRENCNQGNGNRGNSNRSHGARGNQDEDEMENDPSAEDDPFKHSKATSTTDGDTKVKTKDQQGSNNCPQHIPTRRAEFENEAADPRIDKPPLLCNQKVAIDLQKNITTKTRKGKGLNDCIEMLKMKNNKETAVDTGDDSPIDLSAHGRAVLEADLDHPGVYEVSGVADLKALQYIQQNTQQVSQTSFQTDVRHLAHSFTESAVRKHTCTVIQPSGNIETSPVVETEVCVAVKTKALPIIQADNCQAVHIEDHLAIHKGDSPHVYKGDHLDVHTDNRRGAAADDRLAAFATAKPKARSFQPDMRRAVQPVPTLQSEAQLFAHRIANLAASPAQHSAENPLAQPDARALALHSAENLGLQPVPHLAAHQPAHPERHPIHPAMFSAIRPEFERAYYASLAGQAQLAAQYRGKNPMDSRFFRPFDPSPLERGLAYLQHSKAHDQAAHGLPLCQENQTTPSTPPKKSPVRRKSTRLTSISNVPPDLPQNIFGLNPLEMIPPQQFPGPYSSMMISPDSDQTKNRKQHDIAADALINQPDYSKSPKTAEYLHMLNLNMSGGQFIKDKSYQQPVDTELNARSTVESRILEDQRKIAERLSEIRTNSEQAAPLEYRPHAKHAIPDALIQADQRFRVPSYPYSTYSEHIKYAEHRPLPENQTLHENSQYPGMKSHVDQNMQPEARPHPDSRSYAQQMPFQNQMPFPELRPLPRSLEQIAYEQRYLNQSLFPDQPLCPNIAICQDPGKYPEQNSQQTLYPNQALFPDKRTIAEKVVDQNVQNELMKPPEHRPLTKRRLSKELKSVSERKLSTDQRASNEWRPSNDILSIQEQNISKDVTKDLSLSVEQAPIEPRLPAKLRLSAERKASDERRVSAERKASDERRRSAERKASEERRRSAERKASDELRLSTERKASNERRLSDERKESDKCRLSTEPKVTDERRHSAERKESDECRLSAELKEADERRLSAERKASDELRLYAERKESYELRLSAERKGSDERRLSTERKASNERAFSAERKESEERRPSAQRRLSAKRKASDELRLSTEPKESEKHRLSAERKASDKCRLSAERKASDERRLPAEHKQSDVRRLSAARTESDKCWHFVERKVSDEGQLSDEHFCLSAEQKPSSVEYRPFLQMGPSVDHRSFNKHCCSIESKLPVDRAPSMERKSVDSRATVVRAPSVESQPSVERRPITECQFSTEQKPAVESRPLAGGPPSASSPPSAGNPPSACSPLSATSRPSVVQAPALERRPSIEYRITIDQNSSLERRPTLEQQFFTEEKPVVERPSSVDSRPAVVRAPSVESRPSNVSRPSVVRAPSIESRHSIERTPSVESWMSSDRRSSYERDPFCERRLSKELLHVNEHTVIGKEMLCEVNTPSSEQGFFNKQWPAANQQLLHEQRLQAQRAQFFQEQAQLLQSGGEQRLLNEHMSLNERRLSEYRSSTEQKPLIEQELIIQNNALREEETLVQPTYTGLNPHIPVYSQTPMTNVYPSNGLPQNVQKQGYMPIPLDLSSQRSTDTPIPHAGTHWQYPTDDGRAVERNLGTELSFSKGVSWNPSENKSENISYGVRDIPSRDLAEEYSSVVNDASTNLTCRHFQEISNTFNDASRIPVETRSQEYSNTINDRSTIIIAEREPFLFSNIMTNTHSQLHPDVLRKSTSNSDFVDNDVRDNISNTADEFTEDDESFLDIMSTEDRDIKPGYGDSLGMKTALPTIESRIIDNVENIQQLNSNVLLSNIVTASNLTLEADTAVQTAIAAVSTNSDPCATAKKSDLATSSNSDSDTIRSLPENTLSNPVMATTVNKLESTLPVDTSFNASISGKEIESVADTRKGAPVNDEGIQTNDELPNVPIMRNSHMQTTAFEDTTTANRVDASTATNETTDPETARKIALLPPELADVLGGLPTEKRNMLLNVLPQYVSTSKSSPRKLYDSNVLNTSHQPSTSEHMLVHENQNMTNMHGFIPSYQLLSNMQLCPPQFLGLFNMDKNHPMAYLPSIYQAVPPPTPHFTMFPPPPLPSILVAPPPPPPVKKETSQNNPPLQIQSTCNPPLPRHPPPPPLFPLPAVIKTDKINDEDEDVKLAMIDMKEDLENEDRSVDKFQVGPSAAPENRNTNEENIVIDLTEETPPYSNFIELADDHTKTTIPPQQFTNYHVTIVSTPNLKTISDKTSSLRAVRIKTASERNKSSTVNVSQTQSNTELEVTAVSARPALHKEIQQCIKAIKERDIEKVRDSSEQPEQHFANTSVDKRPFIDQFQDSEEEDNKLLQWKISLAIQQAEITSTQQNNKNKETSSKPTATVSPVSILRPENRTNNELINPVAPTEDILIKNDKALIDNSILVSRPVIACDPQQDNHVLDRLQNSQASQIYELIDGAQLPSKDNIEPKSYDTTGPRSAVERLTSVHGAASDGQFTLTVKQDAPEEEDSDDDVSLAIIVKNRDQLKNNQQVDNLSGNKSARNKTLDENIKEDIVLKETTNNLNKDVTLEPNCYINDKNEMKQQLQQQKIIQKLPAGDITKEILQTNRTIKETEENQPTNKTNNRKKSNGDPKLIEFQTTRYTNKEDVYKARNIMTSDIIIDKESSKSAEQLINKTNVIYDKRDQKSSSLKKVVEDGIKKVSLKSNDKEMPEVQKNKQENISTCNLPTTSLNGDDLTTHAKSEMEIKSISLKTVYQKPKEILAQTSITESHPSQNTNIITKESSAVDKTDNLNEFADTSINRVVIENKKSLDIEKDKNNTTPLRRSRRRKSAIGEDDIVDEHGASIEQKTPLTKKQLIFSKLLLDEENHAEPEAHSTPEKDFSPVEDSIQSKDTNLKFSPTTPIIDVAAVQTQEKHDQGKRKRTKRKKSVQLRRLYKKKKSYEFSDKSEARYSQRVKKKSKIRLHSESSVTSDQIRHDSRTTINDKEHLSVTENKSHRSPSANKDLETTTNKRNLQPGPTAVIDKLNTSGDKRKVDAPEDCSEITTKKLKFLDKSKEDMELKRDMHILKEKVPLSLEKRTACYMPVAARRTRSKSVIVKSSTADFYDPYDIDLDDMIEKPDSFRRKINVLNKNTQNLKIQYHGKSKTNIQTPIKTHALVKKSSKPSDYLVNYRNKMAARSKNIVTDSDDSTKSDVPLTKYIEDKEKKCGKPLSNKRNVKETNSGRNGKRNIQRKRNSQEIKRNKRTLTTFNDIDKSSTPNDAEELRSEKFMESFGFFSQRKPRKSNLLASKKISETFHIIANESDDAYFGSKKRTQKRSNQNENKKSIGGGDTTTRPRRRIAAKKVIKRIPKIKKKVFVQPVPCFCRLCKKEFRRPDNFLRHQMTVLHVSKLSEIELKMRTIPIIEKPNYLIAYKRQLDRLKLLTKKFANRKHSKYAKIKLPSLDKILAKVNRKVRQQKLAQRGLSRDEALFIDCCQLLKSNKSELKQPLDPISFNTVPNHLSESTVKTFDLLEKPIKGDGDVDSITAKNILESDEVKNLEKDLISGLKEAANEGSLKTKIMYQRSVSDVGLDQIDDEKLDYTNSKVREDVEPYPVSNPCKTKKQPEVKEKMYPDIIETIDMFEDKFDKIKRKCRSQAAAAAAKQTQAVIEPSARFKCRKKAEKKKARRNSKKTQQSSQVLTKGALKGFDGIKVSIPTSDINMSAIVPSMTSPKNKRKLNTKKKERVAESSSKNDSQRHAGDGMTSQKEVDVYEFLDNEDAVFEFRPSTLMERFKSISYKDTPGTSKLNSGVDDGDMSRDSVSDGDDFVYMSDDYICSDNETENSLLSCELSNGKVGCELKKNSSPLKRKDAVEKNAVMGKIFKFNAVRSDKKSTKIKETAKPKANLDQLFDSLLEDEPNSSVLNNDAVSPKNDLFVSPKNHDHSARYEKYSRTSLSRDDCSSPTKSKSPSSKRHMSSPREHDRSSFIDYGPSTSKTAAIDFGPSTSKKRDSISPKDFKDLSPKKYDTPLHEETQKYIKSKDSEPSHSKSDVIPIKKRDSKKEKSPSSKLDEGISTSYDYSADVYDQYDETGVARQRARRKCTVGKQNVLAETWSSESEPDGIPPRPNSAESVVLTSARRKKGKKRDSHHGGARRANNRHISFKKQDVESRLSNFSRTTARGSDATASRAGRDSDEALSVNPYDAPAPSTSSAHLSLPPPGPRPRARPTAYWSSDGDDEPEHVQQHGWIVGDSHKKLVTMLAHAKGRKGKTDDKRHFVE